MNDLTKQFPYAVKSFKREKRIDKAVAAGKIRRYVIIDFIKITLLFLFGLFCAALSMLAGENVEES
jgi:hypothetical protein